MIFAHFPLKKSVGCGVSPVNFKPWQGEFVHVETLPFQEWSLRRGFISESWKQHVIAMFLCLGQLGHHWWRKNIISLRQGLSKILWRSTWCESTSWRKRALARTSMDLFFHRHLCGNMITRSNLNFADDPRKITEVNQQTQIWSLAYTSWSLKDQ